MKLRLAHLYPKLMNIYGDRGNIISLRRRCEARGIEFEVTDLDVGAAFDPTAFDMAFIGGAQDREQRRVADDLRDQKGAPLREAVERSLVVLAVCGGYQLAGHFYRGADGDELPGLGILDLHTVHPGPDAERFIGNVVVEWQKQTLVGFENHGGRTHLGPNAKPLARVVRGFGNNGEDGFEGAVYRNVFGTYLHGSLLPKNPAFADHLIALALGQESLPPTDDTVENAAHMEAVRLATQRRIMRLGGR
ncbi:MAG: glutamine amidotransferase [Chloroflexota bacterium]